MSKTGIYLNGEWYGGTSGANAQDISYSDFENLTQAQKDNGTIYFIPDYPLPTVAIKPWATATDAELVAMVQAADAGDIDLYEDAGWRVGDERVVHLSAMSATGVGESHAAQDVTLVLVNRGGKELVTPTSSGRTECSFVWGMKDCLAEPGYMKSANPCESWTDTARRDWCNYVFKASLPAYMQTISKEVINKFTPYAGNLQTIHDYFFLPSTVEVWKGNPSRTTPASMHASQSEYDALSRFTYYEDESHLVKQCTQGGAYRYYWWTLTKVAGNVYVHGEPGDIEPAYCNPYENMGISVHGCI